MMMSQIQMILLAPDAYIWLLALAMTLLSLLAFLLLRRSRHWARWLPVLLVLAGWYVLLYGAFVGISQLKVRHVEFASKDLPAAFDGYRIVQFSDAHVGSYGGWRQEYLRRAVDSINAQRADLIVFTGDLQNKQASDIAPYGQLLSGLKAADGVYSVLGNHDYPMYIDADDYQKEQLLAETCEAEERLRWKLLVNSHRFLYRGGDSIVIAGMENDGEGRFPQLGNITRSLYGLNTKSFVVMLEHDPTAWRRKILPKSHCQLTLSGHTHGGQFELLGWTPAQFRYREYGGMYYMGERALNVSSGLNGVIPIRFGVAPEIVVITLKQKK
jgi:hypothetical protein